MPGATTASADDLVRREVVRQLRGPIAQRFKALMPELAAVEDPYKTVIGDSEMLDRCFKAFESNRDAFASFLVDPTGRPVTDNAIRLACGRSVDEVMGMAVRSAMRAYAEKHFGAVKTRPAPSSVQKPAPDQGRAGWIAAVSGLFRQRDTAVKGAKAVDETAAHFYAAIRDALDFPWQVQFFPVYVEIPAPLFEKLGRGLTRLDSVDKLQRLAQLAGEDIAKAEDVIGNPALAQEMLKHNVLAAESVSQMSSADFQTVHSALAHLNVDQKWDAFANKLTMLALGEDKRISKADIVALADYLHLLNAYAVRIIFDLKLAREQIASFLATASSALGRELFVALFGPIPFFGTEAAAVARQKTYASFVETTLKSLVSAVQKLTEKFKRDAPEFISECLKLVCEARRDGIATEIRKIGPPLPAGAGA